MRGTHDRNHYLLIVGRARKCSTYASKTFIKQRFQVRRCYITVETQPITDTPLHSQRERLCRPTMRPGLRWRPRRRPRRVGQVPAQLARA